MTQAFQDSNPFGAERIEGCFAVPPHHGDSAPAGGGVGKSASRLLKAAQVSSDALKFVKAGWTFVDDADDCGTCLGVYRLKNGHLGLAGKALNVKFAPDVSASEIDNFLAGFDMHTRRRLGFAKNLVMVEMGKAAADSDPFNASAELARHPQVEFAEPVVLEQSEHR